MSDGAYGFLFPPLARRVPELAGLEGWLALGSLAVGLDRLRAHRQAPAFLAAGTEGAVDGIRQPDGAAAVALAYLVGNGLVVEPDDARRNRLVNAFVRHCLARSEHVVIACADGAALARAEAAVRADWGRAMPPAFRVVDGETVESDALPALAFATVDALAAATLHGAGGGLPAAWLRRARLLLPDAAAVLTQQARRTVRTHRDGDRPDLRRRVADACRIAAALEPATDFTFGDAPLPALTADGAARVGDLAVPGGQWWRGRRRRQELIAFVLYVRHRLLAERILVARDGAIVRGESPLPDGWPEAAGEIGAAIVARRWLGLTPGRFREVAAETTWQDTVRRFPGLAGFVMDGGELRRGEVRRIYGVGVLGDRPATVTLVGPIGPDREAAATTAVGGLGSRWDGIVVCDAADDAPLAAAFERAGRTLRRVDAALPSGAHIATAGDGRPCRVVVLGSPTGALACAQLRAAVRAAGAARVGDLLSAAHAPWCELPAAWRMLLGWVPTVVQARVLAIALRRGDRLESALRVGLFRTAVLRRHRYAFLGGDR